MATKEAALLGRCRLDRPFSIASARAGSSAGLGGAADIRTTNHRTAGDYL